MKKRLWSAERFRLTLVAVVAASLGGAAVWVLREPPPRQPPRYSSALPPPPHAAPAPVKPAEATVREPPASLVQPQPLPPSPVELPPWKRFATPSAPLQGRTPIVVDIDDMGVDAARSRRAMSLPAAVTLAFLPYANAVARQAEEARAKGHEIIVHVSMESDSRATDPGPNALTTDLAPDEIARRFGWALSRFPGYVGFNNHMGSRFSSYEPGMRVVLAEAKKRGLMFLDSKTAPETVGVRLSTELGIPFAARQVFLDNDPSVPKVKAQLAELERIARRDNGAIAIGHPHDGTLTALEEWLPTLESKGFVLVPLTALAKVPAAATARD